MFYCILKPFRKASRALAFCVYDPLFDSGVVGVGVT